jgi:hypothetical protein
MGRGPLTDESLTLPQFLTLLLAPVMPATGAQPGSSGRCGRGTATSSSGLPPLGSNDSMASRNSLDSSCSSAAAAAAAAETRPAHPPLTACSGGNPGGCGQAARPPPPDGAGPLRRWLPAALNAAAVAAFCAYALRGPAAAAAAAAQIGGLWVMGWLMDCLMSAAGRPAAWLGLRLAPHFCRPLASTSLSEFWSRRWNVTQAAVLR